MSKLSEGTHRGANGAIKRYIANKNKGKIEDPEKFELIIESIIIDYRLDKDPTLTKEERIDYAKKVYKKMPTFYNVRKITKEGLAKRKLRRDIYDSNLKKSGLDGLQPG